VREGLVIGLNLSSVGRVSGVRRREASQLAMLRMGTDLDYAHHCRCDPGELYAFNRGAAWVLTLEAVPMCWAATGSDHSTQKENTNDLD
jgi:hypothetical protein